jgi:glycosyl transferase family 2/galactosyltransferase
MQKTGSDKGELTGSPLFDTLVTVFSCHPNLDTRVKAMRAGWLGDLARLGIPYVVVVGDGDGQLTGDVLHLDAPDDYEGLPQKTLATIEWVHENTQFTHMLKIDDDCFLNAEAFFHDLSYLKSDYYGRPLTRHAGQTDRVWHNAKSTTPRGRLELDKSPEPSTYADGGSGYVLSRTAMRAALDAARSPEGRHLIQVSFMEDKLLGDLLSLRGIAPENEDYRISIRRRSHAGGRPVSLWINGFDASRAAPVKLVHLDALEAQATAARTLTSTRITPKKIWPAFQDMALGYQSNALELISPETRLEAAREAPVAVVACMRNEMFMLPHFLAHYRRLGVESFLIADNYSDDGTLEYLADQPDVALFSVDTDYNLSQYGVAWQVALMGAFRVGRWSMVADADELLVWQEPQRQTLPDLLARPEFAEAEAVRLFMLDLYPRGALSKADFSSGDPFAETGFVEREPFLTDWPGHGPYSSGLTWTSALRHRLIAGSRPELFVAQKLALVRYQPWMRLSAGLHYAADLKVAKRELLLGHFKYNADFAAKARIEVARRQHFNGAEEYRKYLAILAEGRDVIFDAGVSVPWMDCSFVRDRLETL